MLVISRLAQLLPSSSSSITGQQSTSQPHLDRDMRTARAEASGVAHGPGRSGLGRGRYIEVAGDIKIGQNPPPLHIGDVQSLKLPPSPLVGIKLV